MPTPEEARQGFADWKHQLAENWYTADPHLQSLVRHHGRAGHADALTRFGARCAELDDLVRETNRDENLPRLRAWDGEGRRTEGIEFHPSYHAIGRAVYATGLMGLYATPGRELDTLALTYLFAQHGEGGHACPLACTAGLIKILQAHGSTPEWLERLYDPNYDTHFHGSQFLTEVQGGSDVGANAVVAREDGGGWRLYGEKWFCSVIDAHLFLVTARPEGGPAGTRGLMAFAVPRQVDGHVNDFSVRRLKYKLGTRSMASAEVDFRGARAVPVGDFHRVVEVVLNTSRLYNAVCSCGILQRSAREAHAYASTRLAFGQPILAFPSLARIVARLRVEAYAARASTFALAALADRIATGTEAPGEQAVWRMLVNCNKFWTSVAGTSAARDAIEVLGGNGAIEEFSVLPRLLRDSIVCEAWEGGHNVLCAQVLKDCQRLGLHDATFAWLDARALAAGPSATGALRARLADARARFERVLAAPPAVAASWIRPALEGLRAVVQAILLAEEAATPGSDPLLPHVVDDLLTTTAPGYDPLDDAGLDARVRALVA